MKIRPVDFMRPRVEVIDGYPGCAFPVGAIVDVYEYEGIEYIPGDPRILPKDFPLLFRKLKWYEHRTIEQFLSIKYMKVVEGSSYYGVGDIVEVIGFMYNNPTVFDGRDRILFNLKGHYFTAYQLQPATKEEHDIFWNKNKTV